MSSRACPHCKVASHFSHMVSEQYWITAPGDDPWDHRQQVSRFAESCDNCGGPICGIVFDEDNERIWPAAIGGKKFPDVPKSIADTANEAHLALDADAPRASVAMARAAVESTAKERGIGNGSLQAKIDWLAAQGHISESMRIAAHEIRFAGNEAAHGDLVDEPLSIADADEIVALMDAILERVYQEPARIARVRASREARRALRPSET